MKKVFFAGALLCISLAGMCQVWWPCSNPGQLLPDGRDCTIYYECDAMKVAQRRDCGAGLHWNCIVQVCDYPEKVSGCPCNM
ncbi:chitin binding peritrophin-A domain-containing protein [Chitinophaga solisilvae]|uniref:Chitin binding domain-containing protein n=1 Tax=Chitinophaga solisilvae TaxID=1233460 RepID=A0A3S1DQS8_9BACT|nr:chitin binding peritrophin-A domain-containing protein [Chitinophaga solisilvae]NSL88672.1 chitin binding domain-containing protein [Chitinophaga solisilvae]